MELWWLHGKDSGFMYTVYGLKKSFAGWESDEELGKGWISDCINFLPLGYLFSHLVSFVSVVSVYNW
jgi:hypothetical protein